MTRRCLVAIAHNGPVVFTAATRSLLELGWGNRVQIAKDAHGFEEIVFAWFGGFPRVDAMRDSAMAQALEDGFTHVLFLDADMVFPSNVLERMLRHHDAGIVGGLYCIKEPPFSPVALGKHVKQEGSNVDYFEFETNYDTALVDVNVLGMGCTLVPVEVVRRIGARPWFEYKNDDDGWPRVSEDVPFCQKAKAAGFPILFDPTVKCGHIMLQIIDERFHKRYQSSVRAANEGVEVEVKG